MGLTKPRKINTSPSAQRVSTGAHTVTNQHVEKKKQQQNAKNSNHTQIKFANISCSHPSSRARESRASSFRSLSFLHNLLFFSCSLVCVYVHSDRKRVRFGPVCTVGMLTGQPAYASVFLLLFSFRFLLISAASRVLRKNV